MLGNENQSETIERCREMLGGAESIAALTGAGVSAESGVPTFRGADGLWKKYRAEDLATPQAFARDPRLVWEWYNWRRGLIGEKLPNPGHRALAELEKSKEFTLITQNVDGLHSLAGSRNLLEIHGSIWVVKCIKCGLREENRTTPLPEPPFCEHCGGLLRPDVVWFGEALDPELLNRAFAAANRARVMIVAGTSAAVQPAASLAWRAKRSGAFVIEVNLEPTLFSEDADAVLLGPSGRILPQLVEGLR